MIDGPELPVARLRFRNLIIADAALAGLSGVFTVVMAVTVARIAALFWLGVFVVGISALLASALRPLLRQNVFGAVLRFSVANWIVSIGVAGAATFTWPLMIQVAILPGILAASYVTRRQLTYFAAASFVTAIAVACLGLLQDVTGLTADTPGWLKTAILVANAPAFGAILLLVVLQHHALLWRVLELERVANERLAERAEELRRSRQRVVAATDRERRRIERDLHDGAQARLVGINLKLAAARSALGAEGSAVDSALADVSAEVRRAHTELRELARGIYPTVLTQHGVVAAIEAAADRSPVQIELELAAVGRLPATVEATIYFCILEALHNATQHGQPDQVRICLSRDHDEARFEVIDDGVGMAEAAEGHGIANMRDRLGALGGDLRMTPGEPKGTKVTGAIPVQQ